MDFKSKFSEQPTIDISVVKIKGKKLTKSILNQIEATTSYLPNAASFRDAKIIGYVATTDRFPWMLIEKEGRLLKSDLGLLLQVIAGKTIRDAYNFLPVDLDDNVDMDDHFSKLPEEARQRFVRLQETANLHLTILKNHQIYI